jgi:Na+/phosphate symporter
MASRKNSGSGRKARRVSPQQVVFTVIGLLVILTFILGMLR